MEKMKLDIQMFASLLKSWSTYWIATNKSSPYSFCDAKGYIKVYLVSQNTSNNSSYIRIDHYIVISSDNDYGTVAAGITSSYRANNGSFGGSYQYATSEEESKSGSGTGTYLLGSTYHTVNHSSDGTANLYVNGSINAFVYSLYDSGETHYSATRTSSFSGVTLPTIQRASTISDNVSTVEIGQNYAMTIGSKAVSGYTLKLYYQLNSGSEVLIDDDVSAGTYNYELPLTLIESLPSATSGSFKAILKTYNGATLIGSNSVTITVTVPESYIPTCSLSIDDTNEIASGWGVWIKGISKVHGTITAEGVSGSTISSYSTPVNGATYTTAEFTTDELSTIGEQSIVSTVKDSRNRTKTDTETINVLDYSAPTYTKVEVKRCLANGTLDEEGTYGKVVCQYSISPCDNNNTKSLKVICGIDEKTFELDNYSGTFTAGNDELFEDLSASSKYNFEFYLIDSFNVGGIPQYYLMPTASVTQSFLHGGNGTAYGKVATEEDMLDSAWDINTDKSITFAENINDVSADELNYVKGVTSPIQDQIDSKRAEALAISLSEIQNITSGQTTKINFDVEDVKIGDKLSFNLANRRIIIGEGISAVKIYAGAHLRTNSATILGRIMIYKNGSQLLATGQQTGNTTYVQENLTLFTIEEVEEDDYFEVYVSSASAGNIYDGRQTTLIVESI